MKIESEDISFQNIPAPPPPPVIKWWAIMKQTSAWNI